MPERFNPKQNPASLSAESVEKPSEAIAHFTDRDDQKDVFRRLLHQTPEGTPLPLLVFYGVGGVGKSWLLRVLSNALQTKELNVIRVDAKPISCALLNLEGEGIKFIHSPLSALEEIRRQLNVPCPRFELAYAVLRRTQETSLSGGAQTVLDAGEQAAAFFFEVMGPVAWLVKVVAKHVLEFVKSQAGKADLRMLQAMSAEQFTVEFMAQRLAIDLAAALPERNGKACRAVIFIDTFERIREYARNATRQGENEAWVRVLVESLSTFCLVVVAGQNRVDWESFGAGWETPEWIEQHNMQGLSEADAHAFLLKCGVTGEALRTAVLKVCSETVASGDVAYHPWSLGLCADTIVAEKNKGIATNPASFDMPSNDTRKIAERFLKALIEDDRILVERLSLTPRFDKICVEKTSPRESAFRTLCTYSFVIPIASQPGWFTFNELVRDAVSDYFQASQEEEWREQHRQWVKRWQERSNSDTDEFAGLAWAHCWAMDEEKAWTEWIELTGREHKALRMANHYSVVEWVSFTGLEKEKPQTEWTASCLVWLGNRLQNISLGQRSNILKRSITCYDLALAVYTKESFPQYWAGAQNNKGNAYQFLPSGDRDSNLRNAIACYDLALTVRTKESFPQYWAMTQNDKGNAYQFLPSGDRDSNLRNAIACYDLALIVRTKESFPQDWAMTQNNKGGALSNLPSGDRDANLRSAIACYDLALTVRTKESFPQDWAMTQNNKGNALSDLPSGDRDVNLRNAIACYDLTLEVYTKESFPQDWAMTQNNKGLALSCLPSGDRDVNLRNAIACYDLALEVYTKESFPQDWAMTQNNKGIAYLFLPWGDRDTKIRMAIACYDLALEIYTQESFPQDWATTQNNKGNALSEFASGDRDVNLRNAIACYDLALIVRTKESFPQDWAMTQNNKGNAMCSFSYGDRDVNLRNAIACYDLALEVCTKESFPQDWAMTQNNKGNALSDLPSGDRDVNLRNAIACYDLALIVRMKESLPQDWADTQLNKGIALRKQEHTDVACACFANAIIGYRTVGMVERAEQIQKHCEKLGCGPVTAG